VFLGTLQRFPVLAIIVVAALSITLAYSIRVIVLAFFGEPREAHPAVPDIGLFQSLPRAILVGFLLLFGFAPHLILNVIAPATRAFVRGLP